MRSCYMREESMRRLQKAEEGKRWKNCKNLFKSEFMYGFLKILNIFCYRTQHESIKTNSINADLAQVTEQRRRRRAVQQACLFGQYSEV